MTEEAKQLESLCSPPTKPNKMKYWTTEIYGAGHIIRQMTWYPSFLPLYYYSTHGIPMSDTPSPHEIDNDAAFMVYYTHRMVEKYRQMSSKPCYCILSPFVYYRKKNNIKQKDDARGTVVFVAHSTPFIDDLSNLEVYIDQLKNLPQSYHPLTICLHYHDVNKGLHHLFISYGFKVVTAGNVYHPDFVKRFYDILIGHRYATSNLPGSYLFYAIEAGIPYFTYGQEPEFYNREDNNIEKGSYTSFRSSKIFGEINALFVPGEFATEIKSDQKAFCEKELGLSNSISLIKFTILVYWALIVNLSTIFLQFINKLKYNFFKKQTA